MVYALIYDPWPLAYGPRPLANFYLGIFGLLALALLRSNPPPRFLRGQFEIEQNDRRGPSKSLGEKFSKSTPGGHGPRFCAFRLPKLRFGDFRGGSGQNRGTSPLFWAKNLLWWFFGPQRGGHFYLGILGSSPWPFRGQIWHLESCPDNFKLSKTTGGVLRIRSAKNFWNRRLAALDLDLTPGAARVPGR